MSQLTWLASSNLIVFSVSIHVLPLLYLFNGPTMEKFQHNYSRNSAKRPPRDRQRKVPIVARWPSWPLTTKWWGFNTPFFSRWLTGHCFVHRLLWHLGHGLLAVVVVWRASRRREVRIRINVWTILWNKITCPVGEVAIVGSYREVTGVSGGLDCSQKFQINKS